MEVLFVDWQFPRQFSYKPGLVGADSQNAPVPHGGKGVLDLSDCNLAQRMIASGLELEKTIKYLLETFTLQNSLGQMKVLPDCTLILNKHPNFNKGINKILKMVAMSPGKAQDISAFIMQRFPVGSLNF